MSLRPTVTENADEDDPIEYFASLKEQKTKILAKVELSRQPEVAKRLEKILVQGKQEQWSKQPLLAAFNQVDELVDFFHSVQEEFLNLLNSHDIDQKNQESVISIFSNDIDLNKDRVNEIYEKKKAFTENLTVLLLTKEKVSSVTERPEGFDIKKWLKLLKKNPEGFHIELENWLKNKEKESEKTLKQTETLRESIRKNLYDGLFPAKEQEDYTKDLDKLNIQKLETLEKKLNKQNKRRQLTAKARYQKAVNAKLHDPLVARTNLQALREKYGWEVLKFLGATDLYRKLTDIQHLQKKRDLLEAKRSQLDRERGELEKASEYITTEVEQVNQELADLTGAETIAPQNSAKIFDFQKEKEKREKIHTEADEESPEAIMRKIKALETTAKAVRNIWMRDAANCFPVQAKVRSDQSAELANSPEKYALIGRPKFLQAHEDRNGENLWEKYKRLNAGCDYTVPKDPKAQSSDGSEWHPRYINIPIDDFTISAADNLQQTMDIYTNSNPALLFLAGDFLLNLQKDKMTYGSTPAEVLSKIEGRISELRNKVAPQKMAA